MNRSWMMGVVCCLGSGFATAANQTIDFSGLVIPNGFSSSVEWDGYRVTISGGSQPYMQGPPLRLGTVAPNENVTIRIVRIDGADFVAVSANVSNSDENTGMVVAGYNNNVLVGGTSTTVPANTANTTASLATATVDEIRITGQSNANFAEVGYLNNFIVSVPNLPPTLGSYTSTRSYTIGGAAITLDSGNNATVNDADSADFNGGSVRVGGYIGEVAAQDVLQVGNVGPITLDLGTGNVADTGVVIGQVSSNGQAGADLVVTLNASATPARVQNLMRALQYFNNEPASPYIHSRTLLTSVSDGDGALPKLYTTTINFLLPADPANTQKVTFNAGTTVPDIASNVPTSFTSQGFTFTISGGSGAYLQGGGTFPGSPGANMGATGGGNLTLTVNRPGGADFSLDSFVFGNATTQNVSVDLRLNGSSVTTRTLPGTYAQRMDFGGMTIDEIRVSGNSTASPFFQAGTFDELIYYPSNLSPNVGNLQGNTATFTQGGPAVAIDTNGDATLGDADSPNFDTGSLTVAIVANKWSAQDVLQVGNVGSITTSGANVLDGGTQIGTITGNGSGGNNLVVSFNAQATPARVQNLLRALQYRNTEPTLPDLGNRSLQITVLDGDASSPAEITTTMRVLPSALPPANIVDLNYSGLPSQPVNTTQVDFQNYRMTISGGFQRYLQNGFDGPFSPGIVGGDTGISTQTMSLTRVDGADFFAHSLIVHNHNTSVAMTVKSRNNNVDVQTLSLPAGGTQRLLFNDALAVDQITIAGTTSSLNALLAFADELAIKPPNVPPSATASGAALAYTENAAATQVDSAIAITDPDNNWNGGSLRIQITANAGATDQLSVNNVGGVALSGLNVQVGGVTKGTINAATVSLGNPMTVTLNASATSADVQAIARAFAYSNLSDSPSTTTRTATFTATDSFTAIATATRQISVTAVNDLPALANAGSTVYTENQAPLPVGNALIVSDLDNATLASGVVAISGNFQSGEDALSFSNDGASMGNISGSYVPATGVLNLASAGSTATLAQWQSALRAVRYANSSDTPDTATRTVRFLVNDGQADAIALDAQVQVIAVNDPPTLQGAGTATFIENGTAIVVNNGLTVSDVDTMTLASGNVAITANFASGEDSLAFTNDGSSMGNIAGSYNPGSGVLSLTSAGATASHVEWQAALRAVTYLNSSDNPSTASRTIGFTANDGIDNSAAANTTVTITAINDAPVASGGATLAYAENQAATAIDAAFTVADVDNTTLLSASIAVTGNLVASEDVLGFVNVPPNMGNIVGNYNAAMGVLTLTSAGATATLAEWQTALRAVSYFNASDDPDTAIRTIQYRVHDGGLESNSVSSTITVTSENDAPQTATASTLVYTENESARVINGAIAVSDADSAQLVSGSVRISANFSSGEDTLAFSNDGSTMGNITGSYDAGNGLLSLVSSGGTATVSQWQAALRSVTYANSSDDPTTAPRTVAFVVNDGSLDSNSLDHTIVVTAVNDAPTASGTSALNYTENQPATALNAAIAITDVDNSTMASARISFSAGYAMGQDVLAFVNDGSSMGNLAASYDAGTGVLTVTSAGATATLTQWQEGLRAVTYVNTSDDPGIQARTIDFVVNDGSDDSNVVSTTISLLAVNDAPTVSAPPNLILPEDGIGQLGTVQVADVDAGTGLLTMTLTVDAGQLDASSVPGISVTGAPGAVLSVSGTAADLDAWMGAGGVVRYWPVANAYGDQTLTIQTTDNGASPAPAGTDIDQVAISIISVPDAEVLAAIDDGVELVSVGDAIVYTAILKNRGVEDITLAHNARAQFALPVGLDAVQWTCSGDQGATCSASGSGAIDDPISLPSGATLTYLIGGTVVASANNTLDASFGIAVSPALQSDDPLDNTDVDTDVIRLFADGFE